MWILPPTYGSTDIHRRHQFESFNGGWGVHHKYMDFKTDIWILPPTSGSTDMRRRHLLVYLDGGWGIHHKYMVWLMILFWVVYILNTKLLRVGGYKFIHEYQAQEYFYAPRNCWGCTYIWCLVFKQDNSVRVWITFSWQWSNNVFLNMDMVQKQEFQ